MEIKIGIRKDGNSFLMPIFDGENVALMATFLKMTFDKVI